MFVHHNDTYSYYYGDVPNTNKVNKRYSLLGYDVRSRTVCQV